MACPYFHPEVRLDANSWAVPPRLPLGDAYSGACLASESAFQPEEERMRHICNLGYGRGRCDRFPETAPSDAVRFHIARDAEQLIQIQYVFEKDCWPQNHGVLVCSSTTGELADGPADPILRKQAAAFVASYMRRRS